MKTRRRLDAELVGRGLVDSRTAAQDLIAAGRVTVGGVVADKASRLVGPAEAVVVSGPPSRYVGRGAEKLAAALGRFAIDPDGLLALDAGASTGGFTDCLLQAGAARVVAVDVGRGQLHERLRADPRVDARERTDIRNLDWEGPGFDLVVADLSFISLRSVAAALVEPARPGADLVVLVKPQFEVGRREASQARGVIRRPELWEEALTGAITAMEATGAANMGVMVSPLRGADGNVEFLTWFHKPAQEASRSGPLAPATGAGLVEAAVQAALAEARALTGGTAPEGKGSA